MSLVSQFNEISNLLHFSSVEQAKQSLEEFLSFATNQEDCRLKWLQAIDESRRWKKMFDELKKENTTLELKLSTARKLLDQERCKKQRAEEENLKIERQLQMVRDVLFADNRNHLHDETKEKLKFLNSTVHRSMNDYNDRLSAIHELDSTGSMLSELSFSRSEDDLDIEAFVRKKRVFKKNCPPPGSSEEVVSAKRRRSSRIVEFTKDGIPERMVATTTVTMEHDGSMSAQSQIETIPSNLDLAPTAPARAGSLESVDSGLTIENNQLYARESQVDVGVLPITRRRVSLRNHMYVSKTVIRPEDCDVCERRIKFGCTVLRCSNCRASCHQGCKDNLPLPCIAPGSTPISKKNVGVIGDYAQSCSPQVPALVVHCLKEIEERGLSEPGIYRIPGSDKEIKALKEKFMRNRGVPRLADVDIQVVCGCLKDFLRSLKEPLVTHKLWWQFSEAVEVHDDEERRVKLYQAISQLPQPNKDTLAYIILHLLRVAESKETNKMPVTNLAVVLGPTIVGLPSDCSTGDLYAQTAKSKMVLEQFLSLIPADYWHRIISGTVTYCDSPRQATNRTPSTRSFKKLFDSPAHTH